MAIFDLAIRAVLGHEGGYVNDPTDRGGETKWGISKRSYPELNIRDLTREQAVAIYKRDWWDRYKYAQIHDQDLATKVFDLAINMGAKPAHKLLQQALRACELPTEPDGIIGPATLAAVRLADPFALLAALRSEAAGYYRVIIARNPSQERFKNGWETRAYA